MEKNKSTRYSLIAGVLFGVVAICILIYHYMFFRARYLAGILAVVVWVIAYAGSAILFILKRRDRYVLIPLAMLVLIHIWLYILYINYCYLYVSIFDIPGLYFGGSLINLFDPVAYLGLFCLALINFTPALQSKKQAINRLWFVPAIFATVSGVCYIRAVVAYKMYYSSTLLEILVDVFIPIMLLAAGLWIAYPDGLPRKEKAAQVNNGNVNMQHTGSVQITSEIYCGLVKHILLLLFTCGIWYLVWIYRITNYLNCVEDEEPRNPTTKLLLCIFIPFYSIYWTYKSAQRIDKLAATKGVSSDLSALCLILAIFVGIIPPILMQEKLNAIVTAGDATVQQQTVKSSKPDLGVAEELKTYKELLDNGVITQEEFEAKKKQLLDL